MFKDVIYRLCLSCSYVCLTSKLLCLFKHKSRFEHNASGGQRLATIGWPLTVNQNSCTVGQSEWHHSISSHALVLGEFISPGRHKSDPEHVFQTY